VQTSVVGAQFSQEVTWAQEQHTRQRREPEEGRSSVTMNALGADQPIHRRARFVSTTCVACGDATRSLHW
jgi:hypothetical protein